VRYYVKPVAASPTALAVDIVELPSGELSVEVAGRAVQADVVALGRQLSIRVDGKVVDLTTEGSPPDIGVVARGYRTYLHVESERQRAADAVKKGGRSVAENAIRAPMPGRIVKVLVAKGDQVSAGQPILVMEAMKMENEIKAKAAAVIGEVHVSAGTAVESGAKLVTLTSAS
jgi:glutaconyl-CoA/methylmalonyl-CoA decarboxylase subunit gamma